MLPEPLKVKVEHEAEREKVSFGEIVRKALEKYLMARKSAHAADSFFSSQTIFHDEGPTDVAGRHDEHLLKKEPH